jgi:polyhydroxyalkanoate synthase
MTAQHHNANSSDPLFQPFVDQWVTCVQQANEATQEVFGRFDGSQDPQAWRQQWFDALSENTDVYLRSTTFLDMMKAHIDALIEAKQPSDERTEQVANPSDRLGNLEQAMQSRLEQLDQRVDALELRPGQLSQTDSWNQFLTALQVSSAAADEMLGTTPHEVVFEEGTLRLLRYHTQAVKFAEPILICFALVNRPYILDLPGDRSVVRQLLDHGFDVYLIDWGTPTDADRTRRLDDYVCRVMQQVVDFVCEHAGQPQLTLLGYCMGGTLSTMFTALYPERVRNLVLMATPIDFSGDEGILNLWARDDYFDVDKLIDAYGNCPGEFLQYCFQLMRPVQNFAEKYLTFCEKLNDDAFLDNFFAMERWAKDSIPVAGETFRDYVKLLYQQNRLVRGEMKLGDAAVHLESITCPLLLLVADQDHLVPASSTLALEQHVGSDEVESLSINAGHIGLAVSSKAHRQLWPAAAHWIADHSTKRHSPQKR